MSDNTEQSRIEYTTTLGGGLKPVEVIGGPDTIESLRRGDVLQRLDTEERILVLEAKEDGKTGIAMSLPNGHDEAFPVSVDQLNGWTYAYLGGPRFVEVRHKGTQEKVWSAYMPDMNSAVAVYRQLEEPEGSQLEVEIFEQHDDEREILDHIEYYKAPTR